jgi:hypothetical protein
MALAATLIFSPSQGGERNIGMAGLLAKNSDLFTRYENGKFKYAITAPKNKKTEAHVILLDDYYLIGGWVRAENVENPTGKVTTNIKNETDAFVSKDDRKRAVMEIAAGLEIDVYKCEKEKTKTWCMVGLWVEPSNIAIRNKNGANPSAASDRSARIPNVMYERTRLVARRQH